MSKLSTLFILLLSLSGNPVLSQSGLDSSLKEARNTLLEMFEEQQIVGLSITVSLEDSTIWSEGLGYADLNLKNRIEPDKTLFRIASISKPITATILGRLYEEGIVDLEESIYSYVPNFPKKTFDFTLMDLATHRSGIRHYKAFEKENQQPLSMEEGLKKFERSNLRFKPGTDYLYSSYGYNLLGVAMEKASGTSFSDLLKTHIAEPLNMKNTIPDYGSYDTLQTSGFFIKSGKDKIKGTEPVYMGFKLPSGGMLSTSEDLVKLGNAYVYQSVLKPSTQERLLTDQPLPDGRKTGYGLGWGIKSNKDGKTIISHTGGNTGAVCRLIIYPEEELVIAVVSNTSGIDWQKFIRTVNTIPTILLDGTTKS